MTRPLVSVVIPAYNSEPYIREAVDSAFAQTYPAIEVVVVNDGSTDGTADALAPYLARPNFIYISQENRGLSGARNSGIRAAKGEYIALLDSDDLFLPEKIARQVEALEANPEYGVSYCDILHFSDTAPRRYYRHRYDYPSGNIFEAFLDRQLMNPLTVLARRSVFEKHGMFDEPLRFAEDWDLWLRWSYAGVKFLFVPEILAHYRVRSEGNLSALRHEPERKEKSIMVMSRLAARMSPEERERFGMAGRILRLRRKLVLAHLANGEKAAAVRAAEGLPAWFRAAVRLVPQGIARAVIAAQIARKHRSLLRPA